MPKISVVVPSWNGKQFLKLVLPSLAQQTSPAKQIIVVDNGSQDGSTGYLKRRWPEVEVVALAENAGFAVAVNHGLKRATGEFVALLNNDLELEPHWLARMVAALTADQRAGSAAGKMLDFRRRDYIDEVGNQASWFGTFAPRGRGERDRGQYDRPGYVFSASGGAAMYRRSALRDVGAFDEDFYAYLEDVDWGFRAQLRGWRCRYVPRAVAYHIGGATFKRLSGLAQHLSVRNTKFVLLKNFPFRQLVRHAPHLAFTELKTLFGAIKGGWVGTYCKANWSFAGLSLRMLRKRWRIQRRRRVDMAYLNTIILKKFPLPSKLLRRKG